MLLIDYHGVGSCVATPSAAACSPLESVSKELGVVTFGGNYNLGGAQPWWEGADILTCRSRSLIRLRICVGVLHACVSGMWNLCNVWKQLPCFVRCACVGNVQKVFANYMLSHAFYRHLAFLLSPSYTSLTSVSLSYFSPYSSSFLLLPCFVLLLIALSSRV